MTPVIGAGHFRCKEVQDGSFHGWLLCIETSAADAQCIPRTR